MRYHIKNGVKKPTPEYSAWNAMRQRCRGKGHAEYQRDYVDRGITVAPEWDDFEQFLTDIGPRPGSGYSLDRIDNNKGYGPGNCRWATQKTQRRNSRQSKLTQIDANKIWRKVRIDGHAMNAVAKEFSVSRNLVWEIVHGKSWA